jgi:hypothetical protein
MIITFTKLYNKKMAFLARKMFHFGSQKKHNFATFATFPLLNIDFLNYHVKPTTKPYF